VTLTVVDFPIQVSLADIPGRLRWLADEYERDHENIPETLLIVEGMPNGGIEVRCFGDCPSKWEMVGLLTLAASRFPPDEGNVSRKGGA
jgi:hypothetical protein